MASMDLRAAAVACEASWARCKGVARRGSTKGFSPPGALAGNLMLPGGGKEGAPGPDAAGFSGGGNAGPGGGWAPGGVGWWVSKVKPDGAD